MFWNKKPAPPTNQPNKLIMGKRFFAEWRETVNGPEKWQLFQWYPQDTAIASVGFTTDTEENAQKLVAFLDAQGEPCSPVS